MSWINNFFNRNRVRNFQKKLGVFLLCFLIVIFILEIFSFFANKILFKSSNKNEFVRQIVEDKNCTYFDLLFPHPYLGYVYNANEPCNIKVNKSGFIDSAETPMEKDNSKFYIGILGGSVADQMAFTKGNKYLQAELNRCYINPKNKEFVTVKFASGGWKQPQAVISTLLFSRFLDGIISLEGFNEHYMIVNPYVTLGMPSNNFAQATNMRYVELKYLENLMGINSSIAKVMNKFWIAKNSQTMILIYSSLAKVINSTNPNGAYDLKTSYSGLFSFPEGWSMEKKRDFNFEEYKYYSFITKKMADLNSLKSAFFIQPVPAYGKKLTSEEQKVVGDLSYKDTYKKIERDLLKLNDKGVPFYSLTDVFKEYGDEQIYSDAIHYKFDYDAKSSLGYEIVAREIASKIATKWGFIKKSECKNK